MAGLQTIIDRASSIQFDRRKSLGVQYTRSEIAKVSETPTRNPWRFNITMPSGLPYNANRDLIEYLDNIDRRTPQTVSFSNNPKLSWIGAYQGQMTAIQTAACTISTFLGNQLVLTNLPATPAFPSGNYLFKAGDFIQIGDYPYPFTVVNDVLRGSGATVTIAMHRPNFLTGTIVGNRITVGNAVTFNMFCPNMPTYKLIPGATQYASGVLVNNAYLEWSDSFQLVEWTGGI